ncbi:hypothetical protein [Planctomycetes bacterium TBK1r]|uniref:Ribosomal protein L7/L12 C-terminal domain-containing protein n=1 Tax=Stieleria magnilauensis TaxID=2527963 RepID=A0ABX5XQL3_9BACT|nr:hypothetical protein TBK1r_32370 [Planctomycetes bacterium TBK1r]
MNKLSQNQREQILSEFQTRGKIAAVKRYKDWMKCSLLEAKNAVEAIERDAEDVEADQPQSSDSVEWDRAMREIDEALARRKKLRAVKIYRQLSGKSLRECRAFVDARMEQSRSTSAESPASSTAVDSQRSGCFSGILLFASLTGLCCISGLIAIIILE